MSKFSGALQLTDLNDFITPSQACVRPVKIDQTDSVNISSIEVNNDTGQFYQVNIDGSRKELQKTKIDLSDCLACSGCVTSAESVLVNQQSVFEFLRVMRDCFGHVMKDYHNEEKSGDDYNENEVNAMTMMMSDEDDEIHTNPFKVFVVSISPQSLASIAAHFGCSIEEASRRLHHMFHSMGAEKVFDTTWSRHFSHLEMCHEFASKFSLIAQQRLVQNLTDSADTKEEASSSIKKPSSVIPMGGNRRARRSAKKESESDVTGIPMLASACPGFVCYAEKSFGEFIIPYISTTKSPQQIMGSIVKQYFCRLLNEKTSAKAGEDNKENLLSSGEIYHVSIMPCFDKKLEASRDDFTIDNGVKEVDIVLTSSEVVQILKSQFNVVSGAEFKGMSEGIDTVGHLSFGGLDAPLFSLTQNEALLSHGLLESMESGGYTEVLFRYAAKKFFNVEIPHNEPLQYKMGRNSDFKEVTLEIEDAQKQKKSVMKFAVANGFRNIQNIIRKLKSSRCDYDFIEVMACPSGCVNGGGQNPAPESIIPREYLQTVKNLYRDTLSSTAEQANTQSLPSMKQLYDDWVNGGVYSESAKSKFHTQYHARQQMQINPLTIQW